MYSREKYDELKEVKRGIRYLSWNLWRTRRAYEDIQEDIDKYEIDLGDLLDMLLAYEEKLSKIEAGFEEQLDEIAENNSNIKRAYRLCEQIGVEIDEVWCADDGLPRRINENGTIEIYQTDDWIEVNEEFEAIKNGEIYPIVRHFAL